jgi:hypothetical protein
MRLVTILFALLPLALAAEPTINSLADITAQVELQPSCIVQCADEEVAKLGCSSLADLGCVCEHPEAALKIIKCISSSVENGCPLVADNSSAIQSGEELVIAACKFYDSQASNSSHSTKSSDVSPTVTSALSSDSASLHTDGVRDILPFGVTLAFLTMASFGCGAFTLW